MTASKLIALTAIAVLAVSCSKPPSTGDALASVSPPTPASASAPASPPVTRRLAPQGVFFLTQRVSVTADSGVVGIPRGSKVTMVEAGPPMLVTDGEHKFEVSPGQVTNDLDLATRICQVDSSAQAATRQLLAQQAQESQKNKLVDVAPPVVAPPVVANTPPPQTYTRQPIGSGALNQPAQRVNNSGVHTGRIH